MHSYLPEFDAPDKEAITVGHASAGVECGTVFLPRSFGHTEFPGTSIWIDPERGLFVVRLTNRVNSHGTSTRQIQLQREVADVVQVAILNAPLIDWEARK